MARCPFAEWRGPLPASNYAPGQLAKVIGLVVHHADGSLSSADAHFHTPGVEASAHFGVDFDGTIVQWVDTADVAYTQCAGNWTGWTSVENASDPNTPDAPPTAQQIASMGRLIAWLGIPAVPASSPTSGGVGYHRQFPGPCASAWGQTACPGQGFIDSIPAICAAATPAPAPAPAPTIHGASDVLPILVLDHPTDKGLWLPFAKGYRHAPSVNILPAGTPVITVTGQQWDSGLGDAAKGLA